MVRAYKDQWMLLCCGLLVVMTFFLVWLLFTPISNPVKRAMPSWLGGCACEGGDDDYKPADPIEG